MSNNAHDLCNRLLNALDSNYNVVDMQAVIEVISLLEKISITKELLETTRLGRHVNELRRNTSDPVLAKRAKVLVKRWREYVLSTGTSPAHSVSSNRSSAERVIRRLGGTPLTSPALSLARQVLSPAVPSPRPQSQSSSRPAWTYDSDSQDVILVDDDPPVVPSTNVRTQLPQTSNARTTSAHTSTRIHSSVRTTSAHTKPRPHSAYSQRSIVTPPTTPAATSRAPHTNSHEASTHANARSLSSLNTQQHNQAHLSRSSHTRPAIEPTPPIAAVKRPPESELPRDEKKAKRDKKPKRRRSHGRAESSTETTSVAQADTNLHLPAPAPSTTSASSRVPYPGVATSSWGSRNGTHERRKNGMKRSQVDPVAALVNRIPKVGDKKVKTTRELLEQIQSRGSTKAAVSQPVSPGSPDVMLIEPDVEEAAVKSMSPVRNGKTEIKLRTPSPEPSVSSLPPLEDPRPHYECICEDEEDENCPARKTVSVLPLHVHALHNTYLPGINGTRAPIFPHKFAVRKPESTDYPGLFASVVPLYKYSDYADDYCIKNLSKLHLCPQLPYTEFAPSPPELPSPPSPPPIRPYPVVSLEEKAVDVKEDSDSDVEMPTEKSVLNDNVAISNFKIEPQMVSVPELMPCKLLKSPILFKEDLELLGINRDVKNEKVIFENDKKIACENNHEIVQEEHRTVERTRVDLDGKTLLRYCENALKACRFDYSEVLSAPVVTVPEDEAEAKQVLESALQKAESETVRDDFGRPVRPDNFSEWHECARLGDLIALPYVVID